MSHDRLCTVSRTVQLGADVVYDPVSWHCWLAGERERRQPTVTFSMVTSLLGAPPPAGCAPSLPSAAIASMVSRPASSMVPKTV